MEEVEEDRVSQQARGEREGEREETDCEHSSFFVPPPSHHCVCVPRDGWAAEHTHLDRRQGLLECAYFVNNVHAVNEHMPLGRRIHVKIAVGADVNAAEVVRIGFGEGKQEASQQHPSPTAVRSRNACGRHRAARSGPARCANRFSP